MKRSLLTLSILLCFAVVCHAQGQGLRDYPVSEAAEERFTEVIGRMQELSGVASGIANAAGTGTISREQQEALTSIAHMSEVISSILDGMKVMLQAERMHGMDSQFNAGALSTISGYIAENSQTMERTLQEWRGVLTGYRDDQLVYQQASQHMANLQEAYETMLLITSQISDTQARLAGRTDANTR